MQTETSAESWSHPPPADWAASNEKMPSSYSPLESAGKVDENPVAPVAATPAAATRAGENVAVTVTRALRRNREAQNGANRARLGTGNSGVQQQNRRCHRRCPMRKNSFRWKKIAKSSTSNSLPIHRTPIQTPRRAGPTSRHPGLLPNRSMTPDR